MLVRNPVNYFRIVSRRLHTQMRKEYVQAMAQATSKSYDQSGKLVSEV